MKQEIRNRVVRLSAENLFLAFTSAQFLSIPRVGRVTKEGDRVRTILSSVSLKDLRPGEEIKPGQYVVFYRDII